MEKTCPKCNYTRKPTDYTPDYECPSCGVIYSKFVPDDAARKATAAPSRAPVSADQNAKTPITFGQGVAIILLLCAGLGLPFVSVLKPAPQWEYILTTILDEAFTTTINGYGKEGWELVFARRASDGSESRSKFSYEVIFKRRKSL